MLSILKTKRQSGLSMVEVVVAAGLVGVLVIVGGKLTQSARQGMEKSEQIINSTMALEYLTGLLRNRAAWTNTLAADSELAEHLTAAASTATTSANQLAIYDTENNQIVDTEGSFLDHNANPVTDVTKAEWRVTAAWSGKEQNTADITLRLQPVVKGQVQTRGSKTIHVYANNNKPKCLQVNAPIVAGSGGMHTQNGPPYNYDRAIATCTAPYYLTGIKIVPGCGAMGAQSIVNPDNYQQGICYQISPTFIGQRNTTGCTAGPISALDGACVATCCILD